MIYGHVIILYELLGEEDRIVYFATDFDRLSVFMINATKKGKNIPKGTVCYSK